MDDTFAVGEVALFQNIKDSWMDRDINGLECLIVGVARYRNMQNPQTFEEERGYCYRIEFEGQTWLIDPQYLRKRPDVDDQLEGNLNDKITWNDCIWKPVLLK